MAKSRIEAPLLSHESQSRRSVWMIFAISTFTVVALILCWNSGLRWELKGKLGEGDAIDAEHGVVAADDARCSAVGTAVLKAGGHAVDAAVATALCLGVVNPMASGIGGGGFMVVRSSANAKAYAYDMRETAPAAASQDMYAKNPEAKKVGPLSMGVPGELAGLHLAWLSYGRLPWKVLFQPSIKLARDGFVVAPYLAAAIKKWGDGILADPGLCRVFAPAGKLLKSGETAYNRELADSLEVVGEEGPMALYNGRVGEGLVRDVREGGGILTMEDMREYKVEVSEAMHVDVMGYKIIGMPPPSSGTLGLSLVLNILASYGTWDAAKGSLGLHRFIEAFKHMLSIRMNLGDPKFVNLTDVELDMLSPEFAAQLQKKIFDNTTFPPDYYLAKYSQLQDHGTSHFCIVDADRNAVSMTTTVNYNFGAMVLSPSTGIVLNNEMDDFSTPTEISPDHLPPAPSNFIQPKKRPLSSMTPIIVLKNDQLAGVIGGSGGIFIIPTVIQVFLNHFILGMDPLTAVVHPRVYHMLVPNTVLYENLTVIEGDHIEVSDVTKMFLEERGHRLKPQTAGAICQLVVQNLDNPIKMKKDGRSVGDNKVFRGLLTAVSDPRKDGFPAGF